MYIIRSAGIYLGQQHNVCANAGEGVATQSRQDGYDGQDGQDYSLHRYRIPCCHGQQPFLRQNWLCTTSTCSDVPVKVGQGPINRAGSKIRESVGHQGDGGGAT